MSVPIRKLLSAKAVFEAYGEPFTPSWLERKRREGGGPVFFKDAGRTCKVYYRESDIDAWIAANMPSTGKGGLDG